MRLNHRNKQIEKRVARAEEKEILANYVGFGGLPQVFEKPKKV